MDQLLKFLKEEIGPDKATNSLVIQLNINQIMNLLSMVKNPRVVLHDSLSQMFADDEEPLGKIETVFNIITSTIQI